MRSRFSKISLTISIILLSLNCFGFLQTATKTNVIPSDNGELVLLDSQTKILLEIDKPSEVELKNPVLIQIQNRIPVLLVPISAGLSEIKVNPPTIHEAIGSLSQNEMSKQLSQMLLEVNDIQRKIQEKRWQLAYEQLTNLQKQYPKVAFLDFIKASILMLQGKREEARAATESALKVHPNFQEGKEFLKQIGGKTRE